jgi:hypothetical protein
MVAFSVGLGGTILSLVAAWFISLGPPADRVALPYLLFVGPTLWITIALGIILLRHCLRMRIQPNRDFPFAPKLPSGTPAALLRGQPGGELRAATPEDFGACVTNDSLAFRIGRDTLPVNCCNCLQSGSAGCGHKCRVSTTVELEIPRCKECAGSVKQKYRRTWWVSVAISLLVAIALALSLPVVEFWLIMSAAAVAALALASFVASTATAPVKIVGRDSSRGVIRLRFRNAAYAELVAKHINDSAAARSPGLDGR